MMKGKDFFIKVISAFCVTIFIFSIFGSHFLSLSYNFTSFIFGDYFNESTNESNVLEEVSLVRVVDGDTIVVSKNGKEEKVRFLEVNTPESVHSDESKNNAYGDMASDYTKNKLSDVSTIYLEYDKEKYDRYGRTLAYIWLKEDVDPSSPEDIKAHCLNAQLLMDGMAECVIYAPNDKNETLFRKLEQTAIIESTGLWQYDEYHNLTEK